MNFLDNRWLKFAAIIGMIVWIFYSNSQTKKIVDYVQDGDTLKSDINYTISKAQEAMIVSKMSEKEAVEYYLNKQKTEKEEREKIEDEQNNNEELSEKTKGNLSGLAQLQDAMKVKTQEENSKEVNKNIDTDETYNHLGPTDEEKLFVEKFVEEKYGALTEVRERVIKCGDYVSFDFMLYEGKKQVMSSRIKMNLLVGSNAMPEMEDVLTGMFYGQKKNIDAAKYYGSSKTSQTNKKIIQEIKILNIKEVEKKELLNCK